MADISFDTILEGMNGKTNQDSGGAKSSVKNSGKSAGVKNSVKSDTMIQKPETEYAKKKRRTPDIKYTAETLDGIDENNILDKINRVMNEPDIKSDIVVDAETAKPLSTDKPGKAAKTDKANKPEKADKAERTARFDTMNKAEISSKPETQIAHDPSDDEEEHSKRCLIIQRYQINPVFGTYLKQLGINYKLEQLTKKSNDELDKIINNIRVMCRCKSSTIDVKSIVYYGTEVTEGLVSSKTRFNISGWTGLLKADEDFNEALELYQLEKMSFINMSPEVRIMKGLAMNCVAAYGLNAMKNSSGIGGSGSVSVSSNLNFDADTADLLAEIDFSKDDEPKQSAQKTKKGKK